MIILPTRRRLERHREALYGHLHTIIQHASVHQVEDIMQQIHGINLKLKTYFKRHESKEIFTDNDKNSFVGMIVLVSSVFTLIIVIAYMFITEKFLVRPITQVTEEAVKFVDKTFDVVAVVKHFLNHDAINVTRFLHRATPHPV